MTRHPDPSYDPKPQRVLPGRAIQLEGLNLALRIFFYGVGITPIVVLLNDAEGRTQAILAVLLGTLLGGILFLVAIGLLVRAMGSRATVAQEIPLDDPRALRWGIAILAFVVFRTSVVRHLVHVFVFPRSAFYALLRGRVHYSAILGKDVDITDPWDTDVEPEATLGDYSFLNAHEIQKGAVYRAPIRIGRQATVGHHVCIGPGVTVGARAIIASGAVVSRGTVIPDGELWGGIPARKLREAPQDTRE